MRTCILCKEPTPVASKNGSYCKKHLSFVKGIGVVKRQSLYSDWNDNPVRTVYGKEKHDRLSI